MIEMKYDVLDIWKRKGLLWKLPSFFGLDSYYDWSVIVQLENNKKVTVHIASRYIDADIKDEDTRVYLIKLAISRQLHNQYEGIVFKEKSFLAKLPPEELSDESKELLK